MGPYFSTDISILGHLPPRQDYNDSNAEIKISLRVNLSWPIGVLL